MEKDGSTAALVAARKGNGEENHAQISLKEGGRSSLKELANHCSSPKITFPSTMLYLILLLYWLSCAFSSYFLAIANRKCSRELWAWRYVSEQEGTGRILPVCGKDPLKCLLGHFASILQKHHFDCTFKLGSLCCSLCQIKILLVSF